jgi:hypothetical protein
MKKTHCKSVSYLKPMKIQRNMEAKPSLFSLYRERVIILLKKTKYKMISRDLVRTRLLIKP